MSDDKAVLHNGNGGLYEHGVAFSATKWYGIHQVYELELQRSGSCSVRRLASAAGISRSSAKKAIELYSDGGVNPVRSGRGHGRRGVGTMKMLSQQHFAFMYGLYLQNPSRPLDGYVDELRRRYGLIVNCELVSQWFKKAGRFEGSLRETSTYYSGRNSFKTLVLLGRYLSYMMEVPDHRRIVFADEKPMKGKDIYGKIRRDILTGETPCHKMTFSSKNRFNILAAVTLKGGHVRPVEYFLLDKVCTNASIFLRFVKHLIEVGTLSSGDIFVLDNCSVHVQGDNCGLKEKLMTAFGILLMPLPPYHPELNPTELVFNTLLMRMKRARARYASVNTMNFKNMIELVLNQISIVDLKQFYNFCGYHV